MTRGDLTRGWFCPSLVSHVDVITRLLDVAFAVLSDP